MTSRNSSLIYWIGKWIQPPAAAAQCGQTVRRASPDAHACFQPHLNAGGDVEVNCSAQNSSPATWTHFYFTFLPYPLISSKNEGYRLALLRRTGHVALRGCFFFSSLRAAAGVPVPRRLRAVRLEVHCCSGVISTRVCKRISWKYDHADALAGRCPQQMCVDIVKR